MATQVFLSFKNSDNGATTQDCAVGEALYKALCQRGVEVFFSNISLLEFGEAAYKDSIDKALDEAKVLVVLGTKKEYLESSWIKYEWSTFQQDILADLKEGTIITYLDGVPLQDVPRAIRHFQSFNIKNDSVEKLADFIVTSLSNYKDSKKEDLKTLSYDNESHASAYDPTFKNEFERLTEQGRNVRPADMPAINEVQARLGKKKLYVLDLGCAYGTVTRDRFSTWDNAFILGVDISETAVKKARALTPDERFAFEVVDLEAKDFKEQLQRAMDKYNIPSFDVIFGAYVLQHLTDPIKLLRRLREFLNDDGYIILRNSDDATQISYGDNGLIQKINEKYWAAPGVSNRTIGRQLYYFLYTTGYRSIKTYGYFRNLSECEYDERQSIFRERYQSHRIYYVHALEKDPYNIQLKNDLGWLDYALGQLETLFGNASFWYGETLICTIAKKK